MTALMHSLANLQRLHNSPRNEHSPVFRLNMSLSHAMVKPVSCVPAKLPCSLPSS
jgi:hypothetical protein